MIKYFLILFISFFLSKGPDGSGIKFEKFADFESMLLESAKTNKLVFIDFYADWCAPCKTLDKVFLEKNISDYFNQNFINVKVDVDTPLGKVISQKLDVVFLPSLLVVNQYGDILLKIENLVTGNELLVAAKESVRGGVHNHEFSLKNSPFPSNESENIERDYNPSDKEKILYVHDQRASSGRPHIMYHEAYLHLQLMDGKHDRVVDKYLSTQDDWTTEKNIKFIFDFLSNVNSPRFEFFINNKFKFEEVLGQEKVSNALQILVQQRIERGYPRPTLDEAITLYSHINQPNAETLAYHYYLKRALQEGNNLKYLEHASHYLENVNPYDEKIILEYVTIGLVESDFNKPLQHYMEYLESALSMNDEGYQIHSKLAEIYYLSRNASQASYHITKAIDLYDGTLDSEMLFQLKSKIDSL